MDGSKAFFKGRSFKYAIIFIACFVFYGNTIKNNYALDDFIVIGLNHFTTKGIEGIPDIFKYDTFTGCYGSEMKLTGGRYRPLSLATFAIEYQLFGPNPHVSHYINILLLILTAVLLYILLSKIFNSYFKNDNFFDIPFITVLLFIAHPVHTEVVANIKGRDEIMSLAGSLATAIFILKYFDTNKYQYLIIGFFLFFLALLSKENAITFLGVIPLSIYFYKKEKWQKYFYSLLPLITAGLLYFLIRIAALSGTGQAHEDLLNNPFLNANLSEKYATIFYTLGMYIKLLFFPHPLTHDYYPYHIKLVNWNNAFVVISLLVYILLMAYAIFNLRKKSIVSYGILFYLITLSVVSNVFLQVGTFMSERFIFMPSIGFVLIIAWLLFSKILFIVKSNYLKTSILTLILILCLIKTYSRNEVWKDYFTLYTTDVKISGNSARSNTVVSMQLIDKANQGSDSSVKKKI